MNMFQLVVQFAAVLAVCSAEESINYIYGGSTVPQGQVDPYTGVLTVSNTGEFPYLVSLENNGNHFCGGALIRSDAVLTAAHCAASAHPSTVTVRAGGVLMQEQSAYVQVRKAALFVTHENFHSKIYDSDISLIKTETPFELNKIVQVLQLPSTNSKYYGQQVTVVGWGQTETATGSQVLQKSTLTLITPTDCATRFQPVTITYNMLCGIAQQGHGSGICSGDSGGPTVIQDPNNPQNDVLVGVNSFVNKPKNLYCDTSYPSVFTDVPVFVPWIQEILNTHF